MLGIDTAGRGSAPVPLVLFAIPKQRDCGHGCPPMGLASISSRRKLVMIPLEVETPTLHNFLALRCRAEELGPRRLAVVNPDEVALSALASAMRLGIAEAVLVGDSRQILELIELMGEGPLAVARVVHAPDALSAARTAVCLARDGEAEILLKGHLRTDQLLHALLDRESGLRGDRLLSDVMLYEDCLSGRRRLVGITDGGLNVLPTLEQKKHILRNGVEVLRRLGLERPRVAVMSATESVMESLPSTWDASALTLACERGEFGDCEVFGPLALDNALLAWAAEAKQITSPVAGHADLLLVPNIEAGNLLGKAVRYFSGSPVAHVVVGARVPVLIPSRVESAEDKLNSICLGVVAYGS